MVGDPSCQVWMIRILNQDMGSSSLLCAGNPGNMVDAFVALEVVNVDDDNDVSGDTDFHDMTFMGDTPTWIEDVDPNAPLTGLDVEIVSQPERVKLHTTN